MQWVEELGLVAIKPEGLSRVDFSFDYYLPNIDLDEDSFVSLSIKDTQYRKDGKVQTFKFGESDFVLRIYDKIAEIEEQSGKHFDPKVVEALKNIIPDILAIESRFVNQEEKIEVLT